jgi:CHAD domain-containing protein/HD superfamily phosphodiesterase
VTPRTNPTGLRYWMLRVLEECDRAAAGFHADPVHDLRVALRRCRSMADGMMAMDPDPAWKDMKKAGKKLFQSLGELRDTQIMMEWIDKLAPTIPHATVPGTLPSTSSGEALPALSESKENHAESGVLSSDAPRESTQDPAAALLAILRQRETLQKHAARAALDQFDRKQWRRWSKNLPVRAARIRLGSALFKHLALERWTAARELHIHAMRNRSQVALHTLRIGIKRFRYIVENFLPAEHRLWSNDLKHMQDLLGDVHDLDVLWATAISCRIFHDSESRRAWHERILEERTKRVTEYREKMVGPDSLWNVWREGLPQGKRVAQIATERMKLWARALDPDFPHSERVANLALEIYDGLQSRALLGKNPNGSKPAASPFDERSALRIAALLHDVGKARGDKGHHKESQDLIEAHPAPLGWNAETMQRAAVIARFHAGALPLRSHKLLRDLMPDEQRRIIHLAAILRLANAFDAEHDGRISRVKIEMPPEQSRTPSSKNGRVSGFLRQGTHLARNEALVIAADGYLPTSSTAQRIAAERFLLENLLRRPVLVKAARSLSSVQHRR